MLFDFLKTAGQKLFGGVEHKAAEAAPETGLGNVDDMVNTMKADLLKTSLEGMGLGLTDIVVTVAGDAVTLEGHAATQADKEKASLTVGNVEGIATVDNQMTVEEEVESEARTYEVQSGDSLWKVAAHMYSDGNRYNDIFEANQPMLVKPELIYPGQLLRIP